MFEIKSIHKKMSKIILTLFLIGSFSSLGVNAQCSKLIRSYYNCANSLAASKILNNTL